MIFIRVIWLTFYFLFQEKITFQSLFLIFCLNRASYITPAFTEFEILLFKMSKVIHIAKQVAARSLYGPFGRGGYIQVEYEIYLKMNVYASLHFHELKLVGWFIYLFIFEIINKYVYFRLELLKHEYSLQYICMHTS